MISLLIQRIAFRISENAKKWTIVKNKYLVPVPPKRALSAYILYTMQQRAGKTGTMIAITSQLAAAWKKLSQAEKKKYQDQSTALKEKQKKEIEQYNMKYVEPLKKINPSNLAVKKLFQDRKEKLESLQESGKLIKKYFSSQTQQEYLEFEETAKKINKQRQEISKKFEIPEPYFKNQHVFIIHHAHAQKKKLPDLTEQERKALKDQYVKYFQEYKKTLEDFAKQRNLTLQEFQSLIKANQRKLKKEEASQTIIHKLDGPEPTKEMIKQKKLQKKLSQPPKPLRRREVVRKLHPKKRAIKVKKAQKKF